MKLVNEIFTMSEEGDWNDLQWNLNLTNLYITKSSVLQTVFFSLAKTTVKCMEQNLDITNLDLTKSSL